MSDTLIKVEGVSKKYCRDLKKSLWYGMQDLGNELLGRRHGGNGELRPEEFWAIKDVSFELKRGECIGLIGRNGAGKTTLLRMLNGLIKSDTGRIEMYGKVGALIALGAGFNPILTGRENIYVNAAVLGLTKRETANKLDEIIDFAGIGEFIDSPVQNYSSGMSVRLGFAVATALKPEILLLDEVLAVGDMAFQAKCFQRINAIREMGGSILLVTHAVEQAAHFCNRSLLLEGGNIIALGDTVDVLARYVGFMTDVRKKKGGGASTEVKSYVNVEETFQQHPAYNQNETRWGDAAATITDVCLIQEGRHNPPEIIPGADTTLIIDIVFHVEIANPIFGLTIKTMDGGIVFNCNSRELLGPVKGNLRKAGEKLRIGFDFKPYLDAADYLLSVGVVSESGSGIVPHDRRYDSIRLHVAHPHTSAGVIDMRPSIRLLD